MFEKTGWLLQDPNHDEYIKKYDIDPLAIIKGPNDDNNDEMAIVQQYQFSSTLQRMSVIIQKPYEKKFHGYTKGSPEMITSLSKFNTIPNGLNNFLQYYTERGYRVIALAYSTIQADSAEVLRLHFIFRFFFSFSI